MSDIFETIANTLDLNLNEKFKIKDDNTKYLFTEEGLQYTKMTLDGEYEFPAPIEVLDKILKDSSLIIRPKFIPRTGQPYYYLDFTKYVAGKATYIDVEHFCWEGSTFDHSCLYAGNCFRTEGIANSHKGEIFKKLTGEELH